MAAFQVSFNEESVIILKKIQVTKTFVPHFFNHFNLCPSRKKCVVLKVIRKKLQKLLFTLQLPVYYILE